jgi:hypothetical protein
MLKGGEILCLKIEVDAVADSDLAMIAAGS